MITIRENFEIALPIQFTAWVILICSLTVEPLGWFLIPNVNNTPAFITVSIWLVQSLAAAYLLGYFITKILTRCNVITFDWKILFHVAFSVLHLIVISALIIAVAGFEDL